MLRRPPRSTLFPHDALPIWPTTNHVRSEPDSPIGVARTVLAARGGEDGSSDRSAEHTSELQSRVDLVCRLLLEKNKTTRYRRRGERQRTRQDERRHNIQLQT